MAGAGIVIVGAGEAGARTALALRGEGYDGALTLIGAEAHAPYERPPLSKAALLSGNAPPIIASAADLAAKGVEFLAGAQVAEIERAERRLRLADGRAVDYRKLVLATGARPRRLAIPGAEIGLMLRSVEDAQALHARLGSGGRVTIVGAGFIGLELAAAARALGAAVDVVEAAPRALGRAVPERLARIIAERHRGEGVELSVGVGVAGLAREAAGDVVLLDDGRRIVANVIVVGVGAIPETELAARAGLAIDNGIAVDGRLRASDPDIFALGDCASFPHPLFGGRRIRLEAWRNAVDQAAFLAKGLLGAEDDYRAVPWFWSDQYDLCLQIAGLPDLGATTIERDLGGGAVMLFHCAADGRLVGASAVGPLAKVGREVRLAEMLIAAEASPAAEALASPVVKLKSLLPR